MRIAINAILSDNLEGSRGTVNPKLPLSISNQGQASLSNFSKMVMIWMIKISKTKQIHFVVKGKVEILSLRISTKAQYDTIPVI